MQHKSELFIGIDVAFRQGKRLPVIVCELHHERLSPIARSRFKLPPAGGGNKLALEPEVRQKFTAEVLGWLRDVEGRTRGKIRRIAIDAPKRFAGPGERRRRAELEMDRQGIFCFATPTEEAFKAIVRKARAHLDSGGEIHRLPHANQIWMLVGFDLFTTLEPHYECIEVFPHAIARALLPCIGHKSTAQGLDQQLEAVAEELGFEKAALEKTLKGCGYGALHDKLDALMSAWVASLDQDHRIGLGNPPDDVIWVPDLSKRESRKRPAERLPERMPAADQRPDQKARKAEKMRSSKGTAELGFISDKKQKVIRRTGLPGTDHGQSIYVLQCGDCGYEYGANGSDIWQRKCPNCQGGRPGLEFP